MTGCRWCSAVVEVRGCSSAEAAVGIEAVVADGIVAEDALELAGAAVGNAAEWVLEPGLRNAAWRDPPRS